MTDINGTCYLEESEDDNNNAEQEDYCPKCGMPYSGTSCGDIDSYRCTCSWCGRI